MSRPNYYEVLGVSRTATEQEIKTVYRKLAREFHPDVNPSPDAEEKFKEINMAYGTLSDSLKRADYDQTLADTGVRGAAGRSYASSPGYGDPTAGTTTATPGTYEDPNRQAMIRAAYARAAVTGMLAAVAGAVVQTLIALVFSQGINLVAIVFGAVPGLIAGIFYGADMNFKVETFLGSGWTGRSYAFVRTIAMSLALAYYGGLLGSGIDHLVGGPTRIATAPLILLGVLVGAVIGSDGDTPEKFRTGGGRFNLFYTLVRGAEVGVIGALIGAGLGAILLASGVTGLFGWNVFGGFALGMIVGSIKPPNLAAYASYASASVKNVIVMIMVLAALLIGITFGILFAPQLDLIFHLGGQ